MRTLARTALAAAALAAVVVPAAAASAAQEPVLIGTHGVHSTWLSPGEAYDVQDHTTYWDMIPLDGMCGFLRPTLELSDMREVFGINEKTRGAQAGSTTGIGKLLDETFALTEYAPDGSVARVYRGQGDEYAQFSNTADGAISSVNLRVVFRGASEDGRQLDATLQARLRTDKDGAFRTYSAEVQTCHVR